MASSNNVISGVPEVANMSGVFSSKGSNSSSRMANTDSSLSNSWTETLMDSSPAVNHDQVHG